MTLLFALSDAVATPAKVTPVDATTPTTLGAVQIALVIFLAIFLIVVATVTMRRRGSFDARANLPLQADDARPLSIRPPSGSTT